MTTVTEQEDPGRLERGPDRSQLGGQASGARPPSHAQKPCRAPQHEGKPPLPGAGSDLMGRQRKHKKRTVVRRSAGKRRGR